MHKNGMGCVEFVISFKKMLSDVINEKQFAVLISKWPLQIFRNK